MRIWSVSLYNKPSLHLLFSEDTSQQPPHFYHNHQLKCKINKYLNGFRWMYYLTQISTHIQCRQSLDWNVLTALEIKLNWFWRYFSCVEWKSTEKYYSYINEKLRSSDGKLVSFSCQAFIYQEYLFTVFLQLLSCMHKKTFYY